MTLTPEAILARDFPPKPFEVAALAAVLGETEPEPLQGLAQIHEAFGPLGTWRLLQKTLDVEAHGGAFTQTRPPRRRTPGGTFFWLARQWGAHPRAGKTVHTQLREALVVIPTIEHTLAALPARLPSGACTMKMVLIGTPGQLVDRTTYVTFKMTGHPAPSLPKGLPPAPKDPPLTWIVMVGKKQWTRATVSLANDPTTKVFIEGYPCVQGKAHVLLATQCTTTALQQAKKAGGAAVHE